MHYCNMRFKNSIILALSLLFFPCSVEAVDDEKLFLSRIADFYEEGDYKLAEKHSSDFLATYPHSPYRGAIFLLRGEILIKNGNFEEAEAAFSQVDDPALMPKVKEGIAWVYYYSKNFEKLEKWASHELISGNPSPLFQLFYAEGLFRKGLLLFDRDEVESAHELFYKAEPLYQNLMTSEHRIPASFALAEIYRLSGQGTKAIALYEEIALDNTALPSHYRLQAVLTLAKHDLCKAVAILEKLWRDSDPSFDSVREDAAIHWLEISAKMDKYEEIHSSREPILALLKNKKNSAYFYLAQSAIAAQELKQAEGDLLTFVENLHGESSFKPFIQKSLGQLIDLALFFRDIASAENRFSMLNELAGEPKFLAEKMVKMAETLRIQDNLEKSRTYLHACIEKYKNDPSIAVQRTVFKARLEELKDYLPQPNLYWEMESKLLESCHGTPSYVDALRFALESSDTLLKNPECADLKNQIHEHRIFILKQLLAFLPASSDEKDLRKLELAHSYLCCGKTSIAQDILQEFKKSEALHPKAYYLLALAFKESPCEFASYGEKALSYPLSPHESLPLHLELFNLYLSVGNDERAAHHQYEALQLYSSGSNHTLSRENQKWAARFYYGRAKNALNSDFSGTNDQANGDLIRGSAIYRTLFKIEPGTPFSIDEFIHEEQDLFYFAELIDWSGERNFAKSLFQQLANLKERYPDRTFYSEGLAELKLAHSLEKENPEEALSLYQRVTNKALSAPIIAHAKLLYCELKYRQIKPSVKVNVADLEDVLEGLKWLKTHKDARTEPCHLEAGYEYVEYAVPVDSYDKRLFNLKHLKEEFTNQNDLVAKDYHAALASLPEKMELYIAYLRLIDAAILECESRICQNPQEKKSKANRAFALYSTLRQGKYTLNNYLSEKALQGMQRLR